MVDILYTLLQLTAITGLIAIPVSGTGKNPAQLENPTPIQVANSTRPASLSGTGKKPFQPESLAEKFKTNLNWNFDRTFSLEEKEK